MLLDKLTCAKIEKNQLSAAPSACDFQSLSQIYPLLQQMSGKLISFSTIRHNAYLIEFTKGRYLLQQKQSSYLIIPKICPSYVNH